MTALTGKFIVIEGLEGAGKSTAMNTIIDFLNHLNIKHLTTREPGGTEIGETIRSILKNVAYKDILTDKSELLLFYTARMQLLEEVVKPALAQGYWVVADRFELSTFAYQGGGRGQDLQFIQQLSDFCLNGFKPDYTLFLDISPELGMQRAQSRGEFDRIEQQSLDFFKRIHQMYMQRLSSDPHSVKIDASLPLVEVQNLIRQAIQQFTEQQK
ncbi:MAG: dTMP kinase [Legionella sp.]|nr:MAG: dTMP kinase [Legionella sp.]